MGFKVSIPASNNVEYERNYVVQKWLIKEYQIIPEGGKQQRIEYNGRSYLEIRQAFVADDVATKKDGKYGQEKRKRLIKINSTK